MDSASFHKLRTAVQSNANPAGEVAAAGLQRGLEQALTASHLFTEVELGRTDDLDQLIIGVCRCAEEILPWEAGMGVERLWRAASAPMDWEAHHVDCTESLMEFEGAVTVDASGHYVTVHIVAEPARPGEAPADPESQSTSGPKLTSVPTT
jgi:hypothetical protein